MHPLVMILRPQRRRRLGDESEEAADPSTSPERLRKLLLDSNTSDAVRLSILSNPNVRAADLAASFELNGEPAGPWVNAVLSNPSWSMWVLSSDEDLDSVTLPMAFQVTDPVVLTQLSHLYAPATHAAIAFNPHTPRALRDALLQQDNDPTNFRDAISRIFFLSDLDEDWKIATLNPLNPNLDDVFEELGKEEYRDLNQSPRLAHAVLHLEPNVPREIVDHLRDHSDTDVREHAWRVWEKMKRKKRGPLGAEPPAGMTAAQGAVVNSDAKPPPGGRPPGVTPRPGDVPLPGSSTAGGSSTAPPLSTATTPGSPARIVLAVVAMALVGWVLVRKVK